MTSTKLLVPILLVMSAMMIGCSHNGTTDPSDAGRGEDLAVPKTCKGTISASGPLQASDTGFSCTASECSQAFPVGDTEKRDCNGDECPLRANDTKLFECNGTDGVADRCRVTFSSVTACT